MTTPSENIKNPVPVWILSVVCFVIGILNTKRWSDEINEHKKSGEKVPNGFLTIIPIYGILIIYKIFTGIKELQAENGIPEEEQVNPVVTLLLCCAAGFGIWKAQTGLNMAWEKMGGVAPSAPAADAPAAETPAAAPAADTPPPPPPPPPDD